jgi:hypothetical protein
MLLPAVRPRISKTAKDFFPVAGSQGIIVLPAVSGTTIVTFAYPLFSAVFPLS